LENHVKLQVFKECLLRFYYWPGSLANVKGFGNAATLHCAAMHGNSTLMVLLGELNASTSACLEAAAVLPSIRPVVAQASLHSRSAMSSMRVLVDTATAFSPAGKISASINRKQDSLLDSAKSQEVVTSHAMLAGASRSICSWELSKDECTA
jgi:hypothetical protein